MAGKDDHFAMEDTSYNLSGLARMARHVIPVMDLASVDDSYVYHRIRLYVARMSIHIAQFEEGLSLVSQRKQQPRWTSSTRSNIGSILSSWDQHPVVNLIQKNVRRAGANGL